VRVACCGDFGAWRAAMTFARGALRRNCVDFFCWIAVAGAYVGFGRGSPLFLYLIFKQLFFQVDLDLFSRLCTVHSCRRSYEMKRPGRPKKKKVQERNIGFFVTHEQFEVIEAKIKQAGVNISDYMRQAAMECRVVMRWREEDRALFKELVGACNGLQELVEMVKKNGEEGLAGEFVRYRLAIDEVLKKFKGIHYDK
jgi:hypothetical protein